MIRTTNFRRIMCCLLVLLVLCTSILRPTQVYASALSFGLMATGAAVVVGGILIGLGVLPGPDTTAFANTVNSCVDALQGQGLILDGLVNLITVINGNKLSYAVTQDLAEAVRSWVFSSNTVSIAPKTYGFSCPALYSVNLYPCSAGMGGLMMSSPGNAMQLLEGLGVNRNVLVSAISTDDRYLYGYYFDGTGVFRIGKFANPMGMAHCSLFGVYALTDLSMVASDPIRLNYASCLYGDPVFYDYTYAMEWDDYMTSRCFIIDFNKTSETSDVNKPPIWVYKKEASDIIIPSRSWEGYIYDFTVNVGAGNSYYPTNISWNSSLAITAADGLSVGQIADKDEGFALAYPVWSTGAITVPGSVAGADDEEDKVALPFPGVGTLGDVTGLSQTDVWAGTQTGTEAGTQTGTATDAEVKAGLRSIVDFFTGTAVVASPLEAINFGGLFELFPFNIPAGIYQAISFWNAPASAPSITVPVPKVSGGTAAVERYTLNFDDMPGMNELAALSRGGMLILFAVGLLVITRKVTKW